MRRALVVSLVLLTTLVSTDLLAQCAVCGNPAFSAGDNDIGRAFGDGAPKRLRLNAGVVYSYLPMSELYGGTKVESPDTKLSYLGT
ncbi:MAG TPA: hypothetical protein DCQ06_03685, partial [Myxococcales bacterium]|nr:hypothetical protein [Myxococcales bacterium]